MMERSFTVPQLLADYPRLVGREVMLSGLFVYSEETCRVCESTDADAPEKVVFLGTDALANQVLDILSYRRDGGPYLMKNHVVITGVVSPATVSKYAAAIAPIHRIKAVFEDEEDAELIFMRD